MKENQEWRSFVDRKDQEWRAERRSFVKIAIMLVAFGFALGVIFGIGMAFLSLLS